MYAVTLGREWSAMLADGCVSVLKAFFYREPALDASWPQVPQITLHSETPTRSIMFFNTPDSEPLYVSRSDDSNPLSSFSNHGFSLDEADWKTVEHYYQGMKFTDPEQRAAIRNTASPAEAGQLAKRHARAVRKDWKNIRQTVMTRGVYTKCLTHPEVAKALLMTDTRKIVESSMYDYYWGCGRDGRGDNTYGKVLMAVREKLKTEQTNA
jgi:hypothetical protein